MRLADSHLVFCHEFNSRRLGETWWRENFRNGLDAYAKSRKEARMSGIDRAARKITGHSLRHSLNTHLQSAV